MRKIFLETLEKKSNGNINWDMLNFKYIHFIYDWIEDDIQIINSFIKNKKYFLKVKYNGREYEIRKDSFLKCKIGAILHDILNDYKYNIGDKIIDDKRNIVIINRKSTKDEKGKTWKYYMYKCDKCGFDGENYYSSQQKEYKDKHWIREGDLLKGVGCGCCCPNPKIIVENINSIYKTDPWMIPYIGEECAKTHTHSSHDTVYPFCSKCKRVKNKKMKINTIYNTHSIGCSCGDGFSYPNKFMFNLLEQLNINFETEYSPNWCKYLNKEKYRQGRYDFYISSMNLIIEMDGGLGHGNKVYTKSKKTKEETKSIDNYKDEQARFHGIEVIRIDCNYGNNINNRFDYIKQNIISNKKINNLFNLNKINWEKVNEFALNNIVKSICDKWGKIKKINKGLTIYQFSQSESISHVTVSNYLKQGSKLGWCNL